MSKQKSLNNKGFSLVELIIVIAIMAILIGVMAPNLLRYVDRANVSADTQVADSIKTAITTSLMDPAVINATSPGIPSVGTAKAFSTANLADAFGESVALSLGYDDVDGMLDATTGIVSEFRSADSPTITFSIDANSRVGVTISADGNTIVAVGIDATGDTDPSPETPET